MWKKRCTFDFSRSSHLHRKRTSYVTSVICCLLSGRGAADCACRECEDLPADGFARRAGGFWKSERKKDKHGNTEVTLLAEHLAQPGMLTPPATNYIVWFQEEGREPVNAGLMKISKGLNGDFKTTTWFRNFNVFITAESDPQASVPSGQTVLSSKVQSGD
jgi:hypothetical protein